MSCSGVLFFGFHWVGAYIFVHGGRYDYEFSLLVYEEKARYKDIVEIKNNNKSQDKRTLAI